MSNTMPGAACKSCGLLNHLQDEALYNVQPLLLHKSEHYKPVFIITSDIQVTERKPGLEPWQYYFSTEEEFELVKTFAECLDRSVWLMTASRCGALASKTQAQRSLCFHKVPTGEALKNPPAAYITLGLDALHAVTGNTKLILEDAVKEIQYTGTSRTPVLGTYHPLKHFLSHKNGGRDIRKDYEKAFRAANDFGNGNYKPFGEFTQVLTYDGARLPKESLSMVESVFKAHDGKPIGFDFETAGGTPLRNSCRIICFSLSTWYQKNDSYHNYTFDTVRWNKEDFYKLGQLVAKYQPWFVGSNLMYEHRTLVFHCGLDTRVQYPFDDVFYISFETDMSIKWGNGLKDQVQVHYYTDDWGTEVWEEHDLLKAKAKGFDKELVLLYVNRFKLLRYNSIDAYAALKLYIDFFQHRVESIREPYELLKRAMFAYVDAEWNGIPINMDRVKELQALYEKRINSLQKRINKSEYARLAGLEEINVKSGKQISKLVDACFVGSVVGNKTPKSGEWQVNKEALQKLSNKKYVLDEEQGLNVWIDYQAEPLVTEASKRDFWFAVAQIRNLKDSLSKSINPFEEHQQDGLIHPEFVIAAGGGNEDGSGEGGAVTGRVQSRNPSWANQKGDPEVLSACEARPGKILFQIDYRQVEPLVNGFISGDENLLGLYQRAKEEGDKPETDLYTVSISGHLKKDPRDIVKHERQTGKIQVLSTSYNKSPWSYAQTYGVEVEEAEKVMRSFYEKFPGVFWREASIRHQVFMINADEYQDERIIYNTAGQRRSYVLSRDYTKPYTVYKSNKEITYPGYSWEEHSELMFWELCEVLNIYGHDAHALRQAGNDAIQGRANKIMVEAFCRIYEWRCRNEKAYKKVAPHNTVHDSVWGEMDEKIAKSALKKLKDLMTEYDEGLPLRVEIKVGRNAGEMEKIEL